MHAAARKQILSLYQISDMLSLNIIQDFFKAISAGQNGKKRLEMNCFEYQYY